MQKRKLVLTVIGAGILIAVLFASITDIQVAFFVSAPIAAGTLLALLRYHWEGKRDEQRRRKREEHKQQFNFRPGSRYFDSLRRL